MRDLDELAATIEAAVEQQNSSYAVTLTLGALHRSPFVTQTQQIALLHSPEINQINLRRLVNFRLRMRDTMCCCCWPRMKDQCSTGKMRIPSGSPATFASISILSSLQDEGASRRRICAEKESGSARSRNTLAGTADSMSLAENRRLSPCCTEWGPWKVSRSGRTGIKKIVALA